MNKDALYKEFSEINLENINFSRINNGDDILGWIEIEGINDDTKKVLNLVLSNFEESINPNDNIENIFNNISNNFKKDTNNKDNLIIALEIQNIIKDYKIRALEIELGKNKKVISKKDEKIGNLEEENQIDELTGIYNRKFTIKFINDSIELIKNNEIQNTSIILADIDYFKKINDNFGHNLGDEVLKNIAKIFRDSFRSNDIVGRWGGEEFVMILNDLSPEKSLQKIEEIRKNIEKKLFEKIKQYLPNKCLQEEGCENKKECKSKEKDFYCFQNGITSSFGVYNISKEEILELEKFSENLQETIIQNADQALYSAKNNGRNRIVSGNNIKIK